MTGLQFTAPKNWRARSAPSAADLNTYVRDTVNFLAGPPRLRVNQTAVQSGIAQNTWTTVTMQAVLEDNYSGWSSGHSGGNAYVVQHPGWYAVTYQVQAALPATYVGRLGLFYQIRGVKIGPYEFSQGAAGLNPWGWDCYDEVYLGTGDVVWPQFFQEYTTTISTSLANPCSFELTWTSL